MQEERFKTKEELFERIYPALKTKKREMIKDKYIFITETDIWNYMCKNKWNGRNDLTLHDMVNDILNTDSLKIYSELKKRD